MTPIAQSLLIGLCLGALLALLLRSLFADYFAARRRARNHTALRRRTVLKRLA